MADECEFNAVIVGAISDFERVCGRLLALPTIEFAWFGLRDPIAPVVRPVAAAARDAGDGSRFPVLVRVPRARPVIGPSHVMFITDLSGVIA